MLLIICFVESFIFVQLRYTQQEDFLIEILCFLQGIFALVLEANPKLTWRDLQHLVVRTSKMVSPEDKDWQKNKAGLKVNPKFGFGVLDTAEIVKAAKASDWQTADEQHICKSKHKEARKTIPAMGSVTSKIYTSGCSGQPSCVNKLEHVHAYVTLKHPSRGGLKITLRSPSGIISPLLERRERDVGNQGFTHWPFLTVFNWDEDPRGTWELTVTDMSGNAGFLVEWNLDVYGTCDKSLYKTVDERKMCVDECVKGCPKPFSEKCIGCSKFCDCEKGECVTHCDKHLTPDNERLHCRRALDAESDKNERDGTKETNQIPRGQAQTKDTVKVGRSLLKIPLPAKFAVISLSGAVLIALAAAIGYFLLGLPRKSRAEVNYHQVSGTYVVDLNTPRDVRHHSEH